MYKQIIVTGASIAVLALGVVPAFAQTTGTTSAQGASSTAAKIACVGAAVNAREQSIGAAMTTFTAASNAAYAARATALQQAYTGATLKEVKAAVKAAWSAFSTSQKAARKTWLSSRNSAWTTYRTAAVACKAPIGIGDGANSSTEVSGT